MCRDDNHGGRRCPADTSEARKLRRYNHKAKIAYTPLLAAPAAPHKLEVTDDDIQQVTFETLRTEIDDFNSWVTQCGSLLGNEVETDRRLNSIGLSVEYLSETVHGAPKDLEIKTAVETEKDAKAAKILELKNQMLILEEEYRTAGKWLSETGINRETHPIMTERYAAWAENYPAEYSLWKKKDEEITEIAKQIMAERATGTNLSETMYGQLLQRRNKAVVATLEEAGVVFAAKDDLKVSADSHSKALKAVEEAITFYPKVWVEASNKTVEVRRVELRIKNSTGRAHYSSQQNQKTYTTKNIISLVEKPEGWTPDPLDRADSELEATDENNVWTEPNTGATHEMTVVEPGTKIWARKAYEHFHPLDDPDAKPGRGNWQAYETYEETYNRETRRTERTGRIVTRYRRAKIKKVNSGNSISAELTVTPDNASLHVSKNAGLRVALHEFAHRVEDTNAKVKLYENAFLQRRSGKFSKNPETLTTIYENNVSEVGYKDNFTSHYVGKIYPDGSREILSMGMEALFTGTQGGLVGANNHNPDADYKRFLLGVLASAKQ